MDGALSCDLTELFPNASYNSNGVLVDAHGDVIDAEAVRIIVSVKPECIEMSDDKEAYFYADILST